MTGRRGTLQRHGSDVNVFGARFCSPTWSAWCSFLAALFALPMTPEQLQLYQRHTGRIVPPSEPFHEAWLVCGRRAGKSFILALVACTWRPFGTGGRFSVLAKSALSCSLPAIGGRRVSSVASSSACCMRRRCCSK